MCSEVTWRTQSPFGDEAGSRSAPLGSRTRPACGPRGFTLVELLVVIMVIVILLRLLVPALAQAKAHASGAACLGNVRQLQLAWLQYASDHNDQLPPNYHLDGGDDVTSPASWVSGWMGYDQPGGPYGYEATNTTLLLEAKVGRIGPYLRETKVFKCPGDRQRIPLPTGTLVSRMRSYSMNAWIDGSNFLGRGGTVSRTYQMIAPLSPTPSDLLVFVDEHEDSIAYMSFNIFLTSQASGSVLPASRHGKRAGLSFADGHAMLKKWNDARTLQPVAGVSFSLIGFPRTDNDPDFLWLWNHSYSTGR